MASSSQKDFFSSLISEIKNYSGSDPLRPWIHGIRKMRETLPSHVLGEKLPRFLQKCAETFESDRCYRNDSRYLAIWIQLMDYVEDARVILRKMEKSQIGMKRSKFYTAYALFYEKKKRFVDAEKMYHLGAQNLAEPLDELQKSYEQFLQRMKVLKLQRARFQKAMMKTGETTSGVVEQEHLVKDSSRLCGKGNSNVDKSAPFCNDSTLEAETIARSSNAINTKSIWDGCAIEVFDDDSIDEHMNPDSLKKMDSTELQKPFVGAFNVVADDEEDDYEEDDNENISENRIDLDVRLRDDTVIRRLKEDTVIQKFIGSTVFNEPKIENACHHGLVDPTINLKQAMDDINSMFGKTLNFGKTSKKKKQNKPVDDKSATGDAFFILADEDVEKNPTGEGDLFEPTIFTKEAMNEINELFGKPLDF